MPHDYRYECCLAAAIVIIDFFQRNPGAPKHELLATTIFSIIHAMDCYDEERGNVHGQFSLN